MRTGRLVIEQLENGEYEPVYKVNKSKATIHFANSYKVKQDAQNRLEQERKRLKAGKDKESARRRKLRGKSDW